ncbi:MAG: ADP-ribosylglycohydrolase family protein [Cyanobacteria bacterium P01_F01_bin.53]
MLGAIAGDIIGSVFERGLSTGEAIKTKNFDLFSAQSKFTDDTVLSVAVADVLLHKNPKQENPRQENPRQENPSSMPKAFHFSHSIKRYAQTYPDAGYGKNFNTWAASDTLEPYNSWGNGSAMRVSPVGFAYNDMGTVRKVARQTAEVTHNHPEGIKGAEATAAMVLLAREFKNKTLIKTAIESTFGYDLSRTLEHIRPHYKFDVSCQGSVPEAMIAFLESTDFEDAIRNAISLGGDTDTMACIAGAIAEAFYGGVPDAIAHETLNRLAPPLRKVTLNFCNQYTQPYTLQTA